MIERSSSRRPLHARRTPGDFDPGAVQANPRPGGPWICTSPSCRRPWGRRLDNVNQCVARRRHPGDDGGNFQQGPGGAAGACRAARRGDVPETGDGTHAPNFNGALGTCSRAWRSGRPGCGFESQFESVVLRGLAKGPAPAAIPTTAASCAPTRALAVVMLTNEDDCSVPASSLLLDPNVNSAEDPIGLGALQSYRCNEFGHLCADPPAAAARRLPPPHTLGSAPRSTLDACVSAEDQARSK